jgi:hypothetical protein
LIFDLAIMKMGKKPNEIPYHPEKPETMPPKEPQPKTWPDTTPEIEPEEEPKPVKAPDEIPALPENNVTPINY